MEQIIQKDIELFEYLINDLKIERKKAKAILKNKAVLVNNKIISKYNYKLKKDDVLIINKSKSSELNIIYEDSNILVLIKPSGLLTISTEKEKEKTLYHIVREYVKKQNKNNRIFVVHRLDKDTSGIVMFAKSEKIKKLYQDNWNSLVKKRKYYALVDGILEKDGHIETKIKQDKKFNVYVTNDHDGKLAITDYKVIKNNSLYTLLDINILTGRKNQIRVHMKEIGHPILGDKKYGNGKNTIDRLALHAYKLEVINPINHKLMVFEDKLPNNFKI